MESGRKSKTKRKKLPTPDFFEDSDHEAAQWLSHICQQCNFGVKDLHAKSKLHSIEVTLDDLRTMEPVSYFTHLRSLSLSANRIRVIEGLDGLTELQELWLCQNQLRAISGLEGCVKLKKLNLSSNQVTSLDGIQTLTSLQTLWVNENRITSLEDVRWMTSLRSLWLAGNRIAVIGTALNHLSALTDLNLAGNLIGSFKEALNLTQLQTLERLYFSDPNFGENPMCALCNYQTFVLNHLTQLKMLDGLQISDDAKNYACSTFVKKRMYYNMRIKSIGQTVWNTVMVFDRLSEGRRASLYGQFKGLSYRHADATADASTVKGVNNDIRVLFSRVRRTDAIMSYIRHLADGYGKNLVYRLLTELDTGGNIRYEEGTGRENWYKSCSNLVETRFAPAQLAAYQCSAFNITRVIRIHNRHLRTRFEDTLESTVDVTSTAYKKSVDYLFVGVDPEREDSLFRVIEDGFDGAERVALVNTVGLADLARIKGFYSDPGNEEVIDAFDRAGLECGGATANPLPPGTLLVCKVFLQNQTEDTVYPTYSAGVPISEILESCPPRPPDNETVLRHCEEDESQRLWLVSDTTLVLPEYLVEFNYFPAQPASTGHANTSEGASISALSHLANWYETWCSETGQGSKSPIPQREITLPPVLADLVHLNVANSGLSDLSLLKPAVNLKTLVVSFNNLHTLSEVGEFAATLQRLEAGYNRVTCLGFPQMPVLAELELDNNLLTLAHEVSEILVSTCPRLTTLTLFGNPLAQDPTYRTGLLSALPELQTLDYQIVREAELAVQRCRSVTPDLIQANSGAVLDGASLLAISRYWKDRWVGQQSETIEVLQLNSVRLETLGGLAQLTTLRKATFIDNAIQVIDGLDTLTLLEELSLEGNAIARIDGLAQLTSLRKLDLGRNQITKLENLSSLTSLTQLSVENNLIPHIENLEPLTSLMELYISNNRLTDLKDLLCLQANTKLIILDVSGNVIAGMETTREFVVFNLRKLKVLDGVAIDKTEQQSAKSRFSGRLTEELLSHRLAGPAANAKQLDLSKAKIRDLGELITTDRFPRLTELILNENALTRLTCIPSLPRLTQLLLSRNNLETLFTGEGRRGLIGVPALQILDVSYNSLIDLEGLQLATLSELRILRASHNQITRVEHLEACRSLKEVDLRNNKIRELLATSLPLTNGIRIMRLDDNQIGTLTHFDRLTKCQSLHLAGNRIKEAFEVEKIARLDELTELVLRGNLMTRKAIYRAGVLKAMPQLAFLDDREVTPEEISRVEAYLPSTLPTVTPPPQENAAPIDLRAANKLPPITGSQPQPAMVSVRLTSVNFDTFTPLVSNPNRSSNAPQVINKRRDEKEFPIVVTANDRRRRPSSSSKSSKSFIGFIQPSVSDNLRNPGRRGFGGQLVQRSSSQKKPAYYRRHFA